MDKAASSARRREQLWLLALVLGALILRVALASLPRVIRWDEPDYLWLGKSLLSGHGYTIAGVPELHYPPLFPLLAGGLYWLTGNPELGSSFWYALCGALLLLPVYGIARRIFGGGVALLSAGLVAVFPALSAAVLYWGTMTEPLFTLLVYLGLWAALVALDEGKWWAFAAAGALFCLSYLTRPEGVVWLVVVGALFVLAYLIRRRLFAWRTLARLLLYVGCFLLLALPYTFFLHSFSGKWMTTGKLSITYDIGEAVLERDPVLYDQVINTLDPATGEVLWWSGRRFERSLTEVFMEDPLKFLTRTLRNANQMHDAALSRRVFPLFLFAPVLLGWFRQPWERRRLRHEALLWCGVLPVLAFLPFHVEVRFFSPAFPALLIWVAVGLVAMGDWAVETLAAWSSKPRPAWRARVVALLLLPLLAYFALIQVRVVQSGMNDLSYGHKEAGLWLRDHAPAKAAIMSRDLAVSLYAERAFVVSPRAEYDAYLAYARRKGAGYLVVGDRELRLLRPHLAFLLDVSNPPPELEPVYQTHETRGRTIVYRIKD